jgi:hypothetical protein
LAPFRSNLFECLSNLYRVDVIVHVSLSDLQRNVDRYTSAAHAQFDRFAPGWRNHVNPDMNQSALRAAIMEYWTNRVVSLGLPRARHCELIKGTKNQRLYWLIFLAKHKLPHAFWEILPQYRKLRRSIFNSKCSLDERSDVSGIVGPEPRMSLCLYELHPPRGRPHERQICGDEALHPLPEA